MKDIINIIICDDDLVFQEKLYNMVSEYLYTRKIKPNIFLCKSGEELFEMYDKNKEIDLVFLDVNLDGMDGLSVAERIRNVDKDVYIAFISSYGEYAVSGYHYNAFRFIVKNYTVKNHVTECLSAVIKDKSESNDEEIIISSGMDIYSLKTKDIFYIESKGHIVKVYQKKKDKVVLYTTRIKLDELERELSVDRSIVRVHKSFLLNLKYLASIVDRRAILSDNTEIPVSKKYYDSLIIQYMNYKGRMA